MTFATNLKAARIASALRMSELAQRVGISQTALSLLESGRVIPRADTAERIAEALGTSVAALMGSVVKATPAQAKYAAELGELVKESPEAFVQAATVIYKARKGRK